MAASLLRHKKAILLGVFAAYLSVGAWQWEWTEYTGRPVLEEGAHFFGALAPSFLALGLGLAGLLAVLVARRGEPLDRRPTHAAMTGVALIWIAVFLVVMGGAVSALASAIAGIAFLVGALIDWMALFALLRSRTLTEHRDAGVIAPPIVGGVATPIALCEPPNAHYRENAMGRAIVAIPVDRTAAGHRLTAQIVMALACAFVALPGGALAALPMARGELVREPQETPMTTGSIWQGHIDYGSGVQYHFTLSIEDAHDGELSGVMDWGHVAANVEGTYEGDALVFYDRSIRRTDGTPFNLDDRKDVRIVNDRMVGTDKNGRVALYATRIR